MARTLTIPRKVISIALAAALSASNAEAAVLTNVWGKVSIDKGSGFIPAESGTVVSSGDRVRAGAGSAVIDYGNGCAVRVGRGEEVTAVYEPPCGAAPASGWWNDIGTDALILGALLAAAVIAAGSGLGRSSHNSP